MLAGLTRIFRNLALWQHSVRVDARSTTLHASAVTMHSKTCPLTVKLPIVAFWSFKVSSALLFLEWRILPAKRRVTPVHDQKMRICRYHRSCLGSQSRVRHCILHSHIDSFTPYTDRLDQCSQWRCKPTILCGKSPLSNSFPQPWKILLC